VAQPALSKQLGRSSGQVGVPLLERLPRGSGADRGRRALVGPAREACRRGSRGLAACALWRRPLDRRGHADGGRARAQRRRSPGFRELAPACCPSLRLVGWHDPDGGSGRRQQRRGRSSGCRAPRRRRRAARRDRGTAGWRCRRTTRSPVGDRLDFADLLDEPFVALPDAAGPLRDFWLGLTSAPGGRRRRRGRRDPRRGLRGGGLRARVVCWPPATPRSTSGPGSSAGRWTAWPRRCWLWRGGGRTAAVVASFVRAVDEQLASRP
jgi:hypothetical protein